MSGQPPPTSGCDVGADPHPVSGGAARVWARRARGWARWAYPWGFPFLSFMFDLPGISTTSVKIDLP